MKTQRTLASATFAYLAIGIAPIPAATPFETGPPDVPVPGEAQRSYWDPEGRDVGAGGAIPPDSGSGIFPGGLGSAGIRLAGGMLLPPAGQSGATPLSKIEPFSVYVLEDMQQSSTNLEGRVAVGGSANLTGYSIGSSFAGNPGSAGVSLAVGESLVSHDGQIHYGSVVYGDILSGSVAVANGSITQGKALDFETTNQMLLSASDHWGTLAANGSTTNYYGGVHLIGTDLDLNVFSLSGSMLSGAWGVVIDAPMGSTVLVNVSGEVNFFRNLGISFQDLNNDAMGSAGHYNVLYNFFEATSLTIQNITIQGSILAPEADVHFSNASIQGRLIAGSLSGSHASVIDHPFQGSLPASPAVPEPSAIMLLVFAAGGGWAFRRRR